MLFALVLLPALGALGAYALRGGTRGAVAYRTAWLVGVAALHVVLVADAWIDPPAPVLHGWLALDALGLVVLTTVSGLFAVVTVSAVGYLRHENPRGGRAFTSCLLAFLASASLVSISHHLALLWVGMEATTLALAPLIFHRHNRRSLEAVWKYLVLSSVGIALALFGTFFLATAQADAGAAARPLVLEDLVAGASRLHPAWLKAAFVFLLAGYGTKLGLAPMHTWKPDTYGEAPALVGALMAGGLTSCAFLGLARATEVAMAAGQGPFVQPPLIAFGLSSLAAPAAFIIGQTDVKRLEQVLRNLLSNAFKFTERGTVQMRVGVATHGWSADQEALNRAATVIAFAVSDTGLGIPRPDLPHIFDRYYQASTKPTPLSAVRQANSAFLAGSPSTIARISRSISLTSARNAARRRSARSRSAGVSSRRR